MNTTVKPIAKSLHLIILIMLGNSLLLAADRGTLVREAILYLSPDASSNKLSVSWNNLSAGLAQVSAVGNTLTFTVPSSGLNLSGAQAIVIVGNPDEFTDVAPNNGVLKLAP